MEIGSKQILVRLFVIPFGFDDNNSIINYKIFWESNLIVYDSIEDDQSIISELFFDSDLQYLSWKHKSLILKESRQSFGKKKALNVKSNNKL